MANTENSKLKLHCLGNKEFSEDELRDLLRAWNTYSTLPVINDETFALLVTDTESDDGELQKKIRAYADAAECDEKLVLQGLACIRFLIHQAAKLDLSVTTFERDIVRLGQADTLPVKILLSAYEAVTGAQKQILDDVSLIGHGNWVRSFRWRLDSAQASNLARHINRSVIQLTFEYAQGDQSRTITLSMSPEQLGQLSTLCAEIKDLDVVVHYEGELPNDPAQHD